MKITKYGHSALHIEFQNTGFLIDPGAFSSLPSEYPKTDALLLTHEHGDHFQITEIQKIVQQFPQVVIITNKSIAACLLGRGIQAQQVLDGESVEIRGVMVTGVGSEHAEIFCEHGRVENVGYMIGDGDFFYPGDSFVEPPKQIAVLAAPVAAPWMALKEAIHYTNTVLPKIVIPVHDAVLSDVGREVHYRVYSANIQKEVQFIQLESGVMQEMF